jgi:hypothetical protein
MAMMLLLLPIFALAEAKDISSSLCIWTDPRVYSASYQMCTRSPLHKGKVLSRHNSNHSPPSSAEVKNKKELYLLSLKHLCGM